MPYFKTNDINLLLIHIPKTGGTSLEEYFSNKYKIPLNNLSLFGFLGTSKHTNINSSLQHITYNTIVKYSNLFRIDNTNINIIAAVRNPYERIISDLLWFNKITHSSSPEDVFTIIQDYVKAKNLDNHNIPQYLFVTDDEKNLIPNIRLLRTESLTTDMIALGYSDFNVHVERNKNPTNYYNYLNADSIEFINKFYDYDFTLFNYKKL